MRLLSLSALLLVSLSACDPNAMTDKPAPTPTKAEAPKPEPTAEAPKAEAPKPEPTTAAPVAGAPQPGIHECLTACDNAKLSHTDRATCRLNCGPAPADSVAGPSADGGVGQAMQCFSACHEGKSSNAKTCSQGCVTTAKAAPNAPAQAVLEQLGTCVGDCYADKSLKSTDRETCKLTCEQVASSAGPGDSKTGR